MRNPSIFKPDEIHVWINHYNDSESLSGTIISFLSASEIKRANAFRFNEDRKRYIQAHALLRIILSEYTGILPREINYNIGPHGKPCLSPSSTVNFNLSHTKEMIAVAISPEYNIGIDIEKLACMDDMESVAHQFMSREEYNTMSFMKADAKKDYFYQCWVQKEALVKASGRGIDDHLCSFSVMNGLHPGATKTISTCFKETPNTWSLKIFELAHDHIGAVCAESSDAQALSIKLRHDNVFESY